MKRKAFTLVEILIVVILLGILATIAITSFADLTGDAEENSRLTTERIAKSALQVYITENNAMPSADGSELKLDYDTSKWTIVVGGSVDAPTLSVTAT